MVVPQTHGTNDRNFVQRAGAGPSRLETGEPPLKLNGLKDTDMVCSLWTSVELTNEAKMIARHVGPSPELVPAGERNGHKKK